MNSVLPCSRLPRQQAKLWNAAPVIVCQKAKPALKSSNRGWTHLIQDLRKGEQRLNCTRGGHAGPTQGSPWTSYMPVVSDDDLVKLWQWSCKNTLHNWAPYPQFTNKEPPRLTLDTRMKEVRMKVPGVKTFKERDRQRRQGAAEDDHEIFTSLETMLACLFGRSRTKSDGVSVKGVCQIGRRNANPNTEISPDMYPPKTKKRKKKFQWRTAWTRMQNRLSRRFDQELCRLDQDRKEMYLMKTQRIFKDEISIETSENVTCFLNGHRKKLESMRRSGPQRLFAEQVGHYIETLEKLAVSSHNRTLSAVEIFISSAVCHCLDRGRLISEQYWFRILDFINDSDFANSAIVTLIYTFNTAFGIEEEKYIAYTDLREIVRLKHTDDDESAEHEETNGKEGFPTLASVMENFFNPHADYSTQETAEKSCVDSSHQDTSPRRSLARPPRVLPFSIPCHGDTSTWPTLGSPEDRSPQCTRIKRLVSIPET